MWGIGINEAPGSKTLEYITPSSKQVAAVYFHLISLYGWNIEGKGAIYVFFCVTSCLVYGKYDLCLYRYNNNNK